MRSLKISHRQLNSKANRQLKGLVKWVSPQDLERVPDCDDLLVNKVRVDSEEGSVADDWDHCGAGLMGWGLTDVPRWPQKSAPGPRNRCSTVNLDCLASGPEFDVALSLKRPVYPRIYTKRIVCCLYSATAEGVYLIGLIITRDVGTSTPRSSAAPSASLPLAPPDAAREPSLSRRGSARSAWPPTSSLRRGPRECGYLYGEES